VVFDDNVSAAPRRADLKVLDAATSTAPTLLVSTIDADFKLTSTRAKAIYTSHTQSPNGLYSINVP
jgi:hypothetical protein